MWNCKLWILILHVKEFLLVDDNRNLNNNKKIFTSDTSNFECSYANQIRPDCGIYSGRIPEKSHCSWIQETCLWLCVVQMSSQVLLAEQCLRSCEIMVAVSHNTVQVLKCSEMEWCALVEVAKLAWILLSSYNRKVRFVRNSGFQQLIEII